MSQDYSDQDSSPNSSDSEDDQYGNSNHYMYNSDCDQENNGIDDYGNDSDNDHSNNCGYQDQNQDQDCDQESNGIDDYENDSGNDLSNNCGDQDQDQNQNQDDQSGNSNFEVDQSDRKIEFEDWDQDAELGQYITKQLYHGTTKSAAHSIQISNNLKPSQAGRLGPGCYFTNSLMAAIGIGKHRSKQKGQKGYAVIVCRISAYELNFLEATHPRWRDKDTKQLVSNEFTEYCLVEHFNNDIQIAEVIRG